LRIKEYKYYNQSSSYAKDSRDLTDVKNELLWLKEVDKFALQNSLKDLDIAYKNFFREIKKGNKNQGFPKFKSKNRCKLSYRTSFYYPYFK